ncbi:MAG TPA: hypothetical protein VK165_10055 [Azonexus sp.]|nr:hypothetical protein [Azonexus sp.]
MASSIKTRLKALEVKRNQVEGEGHEALSKEIGEYERRACCLVAWVRHHDEGAPIDSVLADMLRHFDESEARRLLAMDYDTLYQAIGMPIFTASKIVLPAKSEDKAKPQIRMPGELGRGR